MDRDLRHPRRRGRGGGRARPTTRGSCRGAQGRAAPFPQPLGRPLAAGPVEPLMVEEGRDLILDRSAVRQRSGRVPQTPCMTTATTTTTSRARVMLNKVPEVTVYFWIIKILCTTVGESFADYINETLGFGLTNTTLLFGAALAVALVAQFR